MIFIQYPFNCDFKYIHFVGPSVLTAAVRGAIAAYLGREDFLLHHNGKIIHDGEIPDGATVHVTFSLLGGKGGFGSMLRAIGAQIEKTTNREACRDLSGRRLRDINEEQRLKKWISKEAEREAEKIKRRQARIERLKSKPAHNFFDFDYEKEISELPERVNDALSEGLQKAKQPSKRPHQKLEKSERPKKSWLSGDLPASSSDSDSGENKKSPSKKPKIVSTDSSSCDSDTLCISHLQPGSSKENSCSISSHFDQTENNAIESSSSHFELCDADSTNSDKISNHTEQMDIDKDKCESSEEFNNKDDKEIESGTKNNVCKGSSDEFYKSGNKEIETDTERYECKDSSEKCNKTDIENNRECMQQTSPISESTRFEKVDSSNKNSSQSLNKETEVQDYPPVEPLNFKSASDLEEVGLERLKVALMTRGLKCGGTLSDRAQRLWKIRGLQPHEYPTNLLAKNKK